MKQVNRNKLILFLTVFIDMLGFSVIFPIFPETLKFFLLKKNDPVLSFLLNIIEVWEKDQSNPYFIVLFGGLVGSIYAFLQFIFAPLWGRLSDRRGRRSLLLFTSLGSFLGYLVWFFSSSFSLFVLSRVITGIMGGNISVASAGMADITSEKDRAKGMGMIGAGIGLGFVFGPPIGGMLSGLDLLNVFPFLSNFGVTIFSGSALISVIISLINFLLIAFFLVESHKPNQDKEKFSHPVLRIFEVNSNQIKLISLINFIFVLGFSGFEFSINFFFHDVLQFTPKQIGFSFVYMGFLIILIQGGVIRRISGKIREKKIAIFGTSLLFIGFLILLFAQSVFMSFLSLTFLSIGSAFLNPSISSLGSLLSSSMEQGKNLGLIRGIGSLARGFSPILYSMVYFQVGPNQTFLASIFLIVLVFIFLLKIKNPETMNDYK